MIDKTTPRAKRFYAIRPVVEVYRGYEIRKNLKYDIYEVIASVGILSNTSTDISASKVFIDKLVDLGIKQDDDEAVARYVFNVKPFVK